MSILCVGTLDNRFIRWFISSPDTLLLSMVNERGTLGSLVATSLFLRVQANKLARTYVVVPN